MFNIENSAIVIIDIQEKLVKAVNNSLLIENAEKLAKIAKTMYIPTIVTEQYPKGLGETIKELKDNLDLSTKYIEKNYFSAWLQPEFRKAIVSTNRKKIIIGGIESHICVLQTALDLLKEGYEVFLLKDITASRNKEEFDCALELLKSCGIHAVTLEILIFSLLKSSKHPKFKELQKLIK